MTERAKPIPVTPDSELAHQLKAATDTARNLELDTGDALYEVFVGRRRPAPLSADAVARSIAGIREAAGSWKDVDVAAFKAYLAERRMVHGS